MENIEGILAGTFVLIIGIIIVLGLTSSITMLNNETKEIIVDCYDEQHNLVNELTCTEELYYCNKFESLFNPESCVKEEVK